MDASSTTAIVAYPGVSTDEAAIFRFVLSQLPEFRTVVVGSALGQMPGLGGFEVVEATFDDIGAPEIVAVPGGVGADRHPEIAAWLRRVSPRWLLASSTGTTMLAAAGLLNDATAATHWLAGPLLEQYGAHPSRERLVVDGPLITCSGAPAAFQGALLVARAYGGPELVAHITATAAAARHDRTRPPRRNLRARLGEALRGRDPAPPGPASTPVPLDYALGEVDVLDLGAITPLPDRHADER